MKLLICLAVPAPTTALGDDALEPSLHVAPTWEIGPGDDDDDEAAP